MMWGQRACITSLASIKPVVEKLGAEEQQLYLQDWGRGTRGRRFHLLTASPPGSQIHPHEFLKHNKAWTVTHGWKPPPSIHPQQRERRWRAAGQREGAKGKCLAPEAGVSNSNGKQLKHEWNTWRIKLFALPNRKQRQLKRGVNVWTGDGFFVLFRFSVSIHLFQQVCMF